MSESMHQGQVAGTQWDPNQYLKFTDHRLRPALELLDRVPLAAPKRVVDLGCGSGNITRIIADRWPEAAVSGLDNSAEMLAKCAAEPSRIEWAEADAKTWTPAQPPDLIFSNAALQWVDEHEKLFPRLMTLLPDGGCLAVQVPLSWSMPSHQLMRDILADGGPGGAPIGEASLRTAVGRKWVEDAEVYYDWLSGLSRSLDIWETDYLQVLSGPDPVLEWVSSTGLRPILNGLGDDDRDVFLNAYRERLRRLYPTRPDGHTLYPFRRLFMVAVK